MPILSFICKIRKKEIYTLFKNLLTKPPSLRKLHSASLFLSFFYGGPMSRQPKNDFPKPDTCTVQLADPHKFARCLRCMLTESYGFDFSIARISEFCFCITDRSGDIHDPLTEGDIRRALMQECHRFRDYWKNQVCVKLGSTTKSFHVTFPSP
ncbi:TPA: hypothetical protein DEP26_04960 [Candidatus Uhrbacteria bacterium]|nr:hypothetical protein [Candidatus Uhrbacteria bacterium]